MKLHFLIFLALCSCASSGGGGWRMPDSDDSASTAPGAAYAGSGMMFRKDMPHQANPKAYDFYYKHCSMNGEETHYSKTSYDCAGPGF